METEHAQTKKSLFALIILIAVIGVSALAPASWFGVKVKKQPYTKLDLTIMTSPSEIIDDTNHDGAVSWNEVVTDTFKDSTSTLAKIKQKPINQKTIAELNDPNNLTSSFSKNIYMATAYLKEKGITDEKSKQEAVNYLLLQEAAKMKATKYTLEDIAIATTETKSSLKLYGNTVAPIIQSLVSSKIIEDDLSGLASFTKTKNEADLTPIKNNRDRVNLILQKLLTVSVPPSAITTHMLAVNRIAMYRDTLDNLSKSSSDPVRGTLSIDSYKNEIPLLGRIPSQFSDYFTIQNIVFSSKEPGYLFTTGFTYQ